MKRNNFDSVNFTEEIRSLIELETEGSYWDFKEMWYDNKTSLLHDIICMSNNLENRNAYIILGIRDSKDEKGFSVVGIDTQNANRKDQAQLITFLRDKKFAGGIRPEIYLHTIQYNETTSLDIIIIKNTLNTPYYLSESFEGVFKSNIYSRIGDCNTPKDKTADIDKVEYLWKKRFGIDLSPLEKIEYLLQNTKDWLPSGTDGIHTANDATSLWYHKQYPEFSISYAMDINRFNNGRIDEIEQDIYWMNVLVQPLHNTYIYNLNIKYHSTTVYSSTAIFADGGRFIRTLWKQETIKIDEYNFLHYSYVEKDNIDYALDNWLNNHYETVNQTINTKFIDSTEPWKLHPDYICIHNPYCVVPVFKSKEEHLEFKEYVTLHTEKLNESIGIFPNPSYNDPKYIKHLCNLGSTLVNWLKIWRCD